MKIGTLLLATGLGAVACHHAFVDRARCAQDLRDYEDRIRIERDSIKQSQLIAEANSAKGEVADAVGSVNIYAATTAGALAPIAARAKPLIYVPNSRSGSVTHGRGAHRLPAREVSAVAPGRFGKRQCRLVGDSADAMTARA